MTDHMLCYVSLFAIYVSPVGVYCLVHPRVYSVLCLLLYTIRLFSPLSPCVSLVVLIQHNPEFHTRISISPQFWDKYSPRFQASNYAQEKSPCLLSRMVCACSSKVYCPQHLGDVVRLFWHQ